MNLPHTAGMFDEIIIFYLLQCSQYKSKCEWKNGKRESESVCERERARNVVQLTGLSYPMVIARGWFN